eukprot:7333445-Pyramimonas_sp.AAC.1
MNAGAKSKLVSASMESCAESTWPARCIPAPRRTMRLVKLRPTKKPCCAMCVRYAAAIFSEWFAAPAKALMSVLLKDSGRVSSGAQLAVSSPTRLSPFGAKTKSG